MSDTLTQRLTGEIKSGSTLGSYEIVGLLGQGAMGRVYRARHARLGREVAIKVLNPELVQNADVVQRFFREARVVNEIDHRNIVEVTDFVEQPGLAYLVMELLDGESIRDLMGRRGRKYPQIKRIVAIMRQVCDALEAAHAKGVVHRDLKPDNVFIVKRDGDDFVKVLDFGVAKLRGGGDDLAATTTGMIIGTPHYMAPEQALGREVTRAADIWAAGVVIYELLAGCVPFSGASFVELAMQIREQPPKPLPAKTPRGERIPDWLALVVAKCLEKKPAERHRSMAALGEALATEGASVGASGQSPSRALAAVRKLAKAGVVLAVLAGLVGLAARTDLPARARTTWERARRGLQTIVGQRTATPPATEPRSAPERPKPPAPAAPETRPAVAEPTPARPAAAPAPVSKPAPKRPATVALNLRSTPPGARVTRLDTGERLGRTPLRVNVARKAASVWIQMALDGYQPIKFTVDRTRDNTANVTFPGVRKSTRRR